MEGLCPAWISKPFESTFAENLIKATNPHWGWGWGWGWSTSSCSPELIFLHLLERGFPAQVQGWGTLSFPRHPVWLDQSSSPSQWGSDITICSPVLRRSVTMVSIGLASLTTELFLHKVPSGTPPGCGFVSSRDPVTLTSPSRKSQQRPWSLWQPTGAPRTQI